MLPHKINQNSSLLPILPELNPIYDNINNVLKEYFAINQQIKIRIILLKHHRLFLDMKQ